MRKKLDFRNKSNCFIVAEISSNHSQDLNRALSLIKKAKECGADAVKFQLYTPDTLTINVNNKYFKVNHPKWGGQTLYQLYKKAYTPWSWFKKLKCLADDLGILFFATAFDKTAVDFLEELNVPIHKIASFELIDLALVEYASSTRKPLILSTGMATMPEIEQAVKVAKKAGAVEVILLKCVSSYPADPADMNLKTISNMKKRFGLSVGLSDHTLGIGASIAAVVLGASIIEKHFTLSRDINTPDNFFSVEPREFKELVENIRIAEKALGMVHYGLTKQEKQSKLFRRSLFVVKDIKKGEIFSQANIMSIRPSSGLMPKYLNRVLGKKAKYNIKRGTPLTRNIISS